MEIEGLKGIEGTVPRIWGPGGVSGRKYVNELSWVISGEGCSHVRKVYFSVVPLPHPGELGQGSLPDTFILPLCILSFWPWAHVGLGISLEQAANRPQAGLQASPFL